MSYYHGTGSTYPYGAYHPATSSAYPAHLQTPGSYPTTAYQTPYPHTAGYGATWPYPYSYFPHQAHTQTPIPTPRPTVLNPSVAATTSATTAATTTSTYAHAPQRTLSTPSAYTYTPRESVMAASTGGVGTRSSRKQATYRGLFTKELRNLMYGFGDDRNPSNDTVNVMEEILVEYIVDVCQTALAPGKKSRLSIEDLRRALSRPADAKKLARMEELLFMQEDIKRARAQFEESDMNQAGSLQG
ncbi:hypothetical protein ABKN59_004109 [Abortiporus biennis]